MKCSIILISDIYIIRRWIDDGKQRIVSYQRPMCDLYDWVL